MAYYLAQKLDVFEEPLFDNSLISTHQHTYKPYSNVQFLPSDEVRICINHQDLILDISESYIYLEGKFTPTDSAKQCYLSNNALAFLFEEIRLEMGGEPVAVVRKPGITTTLKNFVSHGKNDMDKMETLGWGLNKNRQGIYDNKSHTFSGKLPLKYLMGFAEDYKKGIVNVKHELILILARSFKNSYMGETDAAISLEKLEWKVRHIIPEDRLKLKILSRLNKGQQTSNVKVPYRSWDLYELPSLRETTSDVWAIKTCTNLEKPRYVIVGFQSTDQSDKIDKDPTVFIPANIRDIRLYLNSETYPYERMNLDFSKAMFGPAYYGYENFQESYYGRKNYDLMLSLSEYQKSPVFVIDCSHQAEAVKSSTVDIKIEFEGTKSFPANTKVFCLIIHDSLVTYNAFDSSVRSWN